MVDHPGEQSSALAKLQKNAGEGNYRYTISSLMDDDFDDDNFENDEESDLLEDYELEELSPLNVQYISDEELNDNAKIDTRTPLEKITILVEKALRLLRNLRPEIFEFDEEDNEEYELIDESRFSAYGVTKEEEEDFIRIMQAALLPENDEDDLTKDQGEVFRDLLDKHADKLLVVAAIFENEFSKQGDVLDVATSRLRDLQAYPLAKLDLALGNLMLSNPENDFEDVYQERDIRKIFPEIDSFGEKELCTFWLIKTVQNLNNGELSEAIRYYYLYSEVNVLNFISTLVQILLFDRINKALEIGFESYGNE